MVVNLEKVDLVNLLIGTRPDYLLMEDKLIKTLGNYSGSYDIWSWDKYTIQGLSEEEIFDTYLMIKGQK